jgi:hypothetical protein
VGIVAPRRFPAFVVAATALIASGCQYVLGLDPNTPPDFAMPSPIAVYREGRATVTIGTDPVVVLDDVSDGGTYDPTFGAGATFSNPDGWYVRVTGASRLGAFVASPAYVQLDRIVSNQHWTTSDPSRCVVTLSTADATGLMGKATCKGMRWSDALGNWLGNGVAGGYQPPLIKDQPEFDAEITFQATPSKTQQG